MRIRAVLAGPSGRREEIDFLAGTAAFYSLLPPVVADRLGMDFSLNTPVTIGDREVSLPVGLAHLELGGRSAGVLVGRADVPEPILGRSSLEAVGFDVNCVDGTLVATRSYPHVPMFAA